MDKIREREEEGGEEEEIEATSIIILERITVTGYQQPRQGEGGEKGREKDYEDHVINVVLYNNRYYCIDDPILLKEKEGKVKVRVITEVKNEEELYREYIRNNSRNTLNPYALLLLVKEKNIITDLLPTPLSKVLTIDIPEEVLSRLNEHLLELEEEESKYSKIISIELDILLAVKELLEEGYTVEEIIELVELGIFENDLILKYPTSMALLMLAESLTTKEEKKEERERKKEEKERKEKELKEKFKDISASIEEIEEEGGEVEVPVTVPTPTTVTAGVEVPIPSSSDSSSNSVSSNGVSSNSVSNDINNSTLHADRISTRKVTFYNLSIVISIRCPAYFVENVREELKTIKEYAYRRLKKYGTVNIK